MFHDNIQSHIASFKAKGFNCQSFLYTVTSFCLETDAMYLQIDYRYTWLIGIVNNATNIKGLIVFYIKYLYVDDADDEHVFCYSTASALALYNTTK